MWQQCIIYKVILCLNLSSLDSRRYVIYKDLEIRNEKFKSFLSSNDDDLCGDDDNEDTTRERSWFLVCCIAPGHPGVTCYTLIYSLTHSLALVDKTLQYTCRSETCVYRNTYILYVHTCYTLMILTHSPLSFCGQNITSATLNRSLLYTLDPYHTLLILQIHVHGNCILICNWLCDILVRQLTIHMHSCLEKSPITTTNIFWVMTKYHQFTYSFSTFIEEEK